MHADASTPRLWQRGAAQLARSIARGEVSSRAVIDAHLERIERVNPEVNALRVILAEEARAAADAADRMLGAGEAIGPLHGVPFSVKENVDVAGTATTWGLAAMAQSVSPTDAPVVANLRAVGAIPIARGNMPDLAIRWHTDNALAGATLNPWDRTRTPGGSSGGDAVALATGMVPLGVGNDLGGSLRWPSQCVGTAALRPSHGRIPDARSLPPSENALSIQLFNCQGPMARRVEDLRVAFAAMIAPNPRDPWHVPAPAHATPPGGPVRVSVALPARTDPEIADGVRRAADALAEVGYALREELPPDLDQAAALWAELLNDDVRRSWPAAEPIVSSGARQHTTNALNATKPLDVEGYALRWQTREALARRWSLHQAQSPLILAPISLRRPFMPDADAAGPDELRDIVDGMRMVVPVNLLGLPSVAVPAGLDDRGLPLAVQIIGPRFREDLCLDAAAAIEAAVDALTPIDPRV